MVVKGKKDEIIENATDGNHNDNNPATMLSRSDTLMHVNKINRNMKSMIERGDLDFRREA